MAKKSSFLNHHSIDMLKTAIPYMNPQAQKSVEVLVKTEELMDTIHILEQPSELSACNINKEPFDMEAMLMQMKEIGTKKEQETIDNVLGFIKMQKLMQAYNLFMSTNKKANSDSNTKETSSSQDTLTEFLMSQLSADQKANFENINLVLNAMNN